MINLSKGRYWDLPWSLVSGCTRCSSGCQNCWSLALEKRFHRGVEGKVEIHPERFGIPKRRHKPTVYAIWNDLFHEDVPQGFIWEALDLMATWDQHTYLVLTKRISRLLTIRPFPKPYLSNAPNIWLGVTVCNQDEADEKIPILLSIPAAHRFISYEPALGQLLIKWWLDGNHESGNKPDLLICGGETGPKARPMNPFWARSVRDQCQAAGVPFFLKSGMGKKRTYWSDEIEEWGNMTKKLSNCLDDGHIGGYALHRLLDGREWNELPWKKE